MQIKKHGGLEVPVTDYKTFFHIKGTLNSRAMSNSTIEELTEALVDQNVTNKECLEILKEGKLIEQTDL